MTAFGLYLHIPYCDSKCPYCDFNSYAAKQWPERAYAAALIAEMRAAAAQPAWAAGRVQTIFFGGGTPSLFAPATIAELLAAARAAWPVAADAEITLEANPGTVDEAKLRGFRQAGVNRISFGVQSFHDQHLRTLGRIHSAAEARAAIAAARAAGFANLNLDLIFAVPGQTAEQWNADLQTAVELAPEHISAYGLTYEEGTAFHAQRRSGALTPLPEEAEVAMFTQTRRVLAASGYDAYEISNFARPGRACAHNLNYWRAGAYLGLGAGAHSFAPHPAPGRRWGNEKSPVRYTERATASGTARASEEQLSEAQARGEIAFLGLRCTDGFALDEFAARFGCDAASAFPHLDRLVRDGLVEIAGDRCRLTARGLLVADSVFATFL
ncbi:radical SAM family heme chaperone HemW [bacterium]|nr:radical SAM family heme chaperone HemW [bacterium]